MSVTAPSASAPPSARSGPAKRPAAAAVIECGMPKFTRRHFVAGGAAAAATQIACEGDNQAQSPAVAKELEKPVEQSGNGLNLIEICVDTWGTHFLGCYGNEWIKTPNVDRLASKSAVFEHCYPETLPTIPTRRVLYTGRRIFPTKQIAQPGDTVRISGWHQLYAEDITFAEMLTAAGYTTAQISDLYHTFKPGKNFHRGFQCWRWIRGHEADRLESGPKSKIDMTKYTHASRQPSRGVQQYLMNRYEWKHEEEWLPAQLFRDAMRWLDRNTDEKPFYLLIESFAPHEYWDPHEDYYHLYMKSQYDGPKLISAPGTTENLSQVEVEHVKALYSGYVTMVDHWIGQLLDKVESMGLLDSTLVVFTGDHGTLLGEQGQIHKGERRMRDQVNHVPLLVWDPRESYNGKRIGGFVQHTDIVPSLLELMGLKAPKRVTGESFVPLLTGASSGGLRDHVVTGWGEHATVRTHEWNYLTRHTAGDNYAEQLYDLKKDPLELNNVVSSNRSVAEACREMLDEYIESGRDITGGSFHWDIPAAGG